MDRVFVDFETYYDREYSLRKMTTREYIMDDRFRATMLSVAVNDSAPFLLVGDDIGEWVSRQDWGNSCVIAHNIKFDGAILKWRYGIETPALWYCTLSLAAMTIGHRIGGTALDKVTKALGLAEKDSEALHAVEGVDVLSLDRDGAVFRRLADYATQDVASSRDIFGVLNPRINRKHRLIIHLIASMYIDGDMRIDATMCDKVLAEARLETERLLTRTGVTDRGVFRSRDKFATLLESHGVTCPTKISRTTGKETWAQSKKDIEFVKLLDHDDERIRFLVEMRLNAASSILETRAKRFSAIAQVGEGQLHAPLLVAGAHTARFSGTDSLNMQNLPRGSALKRAVVAPEGYTFVVVDASQIEARILAWLAGCMEVVNAFAGGEDVYASFASKAFGYPVNKKNHPVERFIGKTCIAEDTPVLTNRGWVPIQSVKRTDRLWDGVEWVDHQGLISNGTKKTLEICGLSLTPDHLILCGTKWLPASSVAEDENILSLALDRGAENLPSQVTSGVKGPSRQSSSGAIARATSTLSTLTTFALSSLRGARNALKKRRPLNVIGFTQKQCPTTSIAAGFSTDSQPLYRDATTLATEPTRITVREGCTSAEIGSRTRGLFFDMFRPYRGGMNPLLKWTGSTSTGGTSRAISGLLRAEATSTTAVISQTWSGKSETSKRKTLRLKPVFDVLNAGPRNRFTVMTDKGPLIVHNCVLGLGYGTGYETLYKTLVLGGAKDVTLEFSKKLVDTYRSGYPEIPTLWQRMEHMLGEMIAGRRYQIGPVVGEGDEVWVEDEEGEPNFRIAYPALRRVTTTTPWGTSKLGYEFWRSRFKSFIALRGSTLTENVVQHLAWLQIADTVVKIMMHCKVRRKDWHWVLQVHDEVVYLVPEDEADEALNYIIERMCDQPRWARWKSYPVPFAAEGDIAKRYGDAK